MPIIVKDYTWEETDANLVITVPLKGVKSNKVDIFLGDEYLKISYPPYLFECLLYDIVDNKKSVASIGNGVVLIKLVKIDKKIWTQLNSPDFLNKEVMKQKRIESIEKGQAQAEQDAKERTEKKREAEKFALNKMMKIDQNERERIENVKQQEREQATAELEEWKEKQKVLAEFEKVKLLEEKNAAEKIRVQQQKEEEQVQSKKTARKKKDIFAEQARGTDVRQTGKIDVNFTPRVFPSAARESTKEKEDEWLRKQAETRRIADAQDADLTEEERNPVWLRDKGNQLFKTGNYQGAINAYSHAIRLDSKMPSLYSNRSACHLKIGNCMKAAEDSTKALELLTPPVDQNAASRVKAHIRRGTAYCQLQLYVEGLQDYDAALKIDPKNEELIKDADKIREIIQQTGLD